MSRNGLLSYYHVVFEVEGGEEDYDNDSTDSLNEDDTIQSSFAFIIINFIIVYINCTSYSTPFSTSFSTCYDSTLIVHVYSTPLPYAL